MFESLLEEHVYSLKIGDNFLASGCRELCTSG